MERQALTSPEADYRYLSDVLPGDRQALFSIRRDNASMDYGNVYLISLETLDSTLLIESGYEARYLESGHLVFARAGHLMAVAFDLDRLEVVGEPVSVVSEVAMNSFFPHAQYSVSDNGTLAYAVGGDLALGKLAWIDRAGAVEYLPVPERLYGPVDVSADGSRIAVQVSDVTDYVWVWDVERAEGRRISTAGASGWPALDATGRRVAFGARLAEGWGVAVAELDGGAEPQVVFTAGDPNPLWVSAWTRDGSVLAFSETRAELWKPVQAQGIAGLRVLPAYYSTSFSPDGRWVAYPDQAGVLTQIFSRSFPDGETLHQISVDGGAESVWWDRCGEILYRVASFAQYGFFHSARVSHGEDLEWEPPAKAFASTLRLLDVDNRTGEPSQLDVEGAYNSFWWDWGTELSEDLRTSLIVDPPDGRLPAITAEARARLEEQNRLRTPPVRDLLSYSANTATFRPAGPESVGLSERCLSPPRSRTSNAAPSAPAGTCT